MNRVFEIQNVITDSRSPAIWEKTLFIALRGLKDNGSRFVQDFITKGGKVVMCEKSPVENVAHILVDNTLVALQKLAGYHRSQFTIPVIGITGSNGKTVVKEWLYHVMKDDFHIVRSPKSYNSQLGVALSVLEMTSENTLAIFEAGISKPGEMEKLTRIIRPTIGVFTGIGDAHSANFTSDQEKKSEKLKLFSTAERFFEPLPDDPLPLIPYSDKGSLENARVVYKVAKHFGLSEEKILQRLAELPPVSMRMEQISGKNGCLILNDAYSADVQSLEIALQYIAQFRKYKKKVLFLSPLEDNSEQKRLKDLIASARVDEIVIIGKNPDVEKAIVKTSVAEYLKNPLNYEDALLLIKGSRKAGLEKIVQYYADKKHITRLLIDFGAVRNNLNYFRERIGSGTKILGMVKAQSYGSGIVEMAKFLESEKCDYLGVAYADEGVSLRQAGITLPILVMNPEASGYDDIIDFDLEPSIYSIESLDEFIHELILRQKEHFPIHLKLDTGMNRLGFRDEDLHDLMGILRAQPEVYVKTIFSHLSAADVQHERDFTFSQIRKFEIMSGYIMDRLGYPVTRHLANSAGAVNYGGSLFDMVRLGIGLFGLLEEENNFLENGLTLMSKISQIKKVKQGESIGYGRTYIAEEEQLIGIVPIGYADGLRRSLSSGIWSVIVNGQRAPIIGNICMDMCMIDLRGIDAKRGDDVQIFGAGNTIFEMAMALNSIPYEIISAISSRVHRVYLEG